MIMFFMIFWVVAFLLFVSSAEIDICVPSFPQIQACFNLTPFTTEMLLGVNLFFHCIAALFAGTLGDKYGKKRSINYGLWVFAVGSFICYLSNDYNIILVGRALQGMGVAMPMVLAPLIILDIYKPSEQQSMMTVLNGLTTLAICIAPGFGSYLTLFFDWKANFLALAILSIAALILSYVVLPNDNKNDPSVKMSIKQYKIVFSKPITVICIIIFCLECGSYYAFVGMAPIIYIDSFNVSLAMFGVYQGVLTLSFGIFSIFSKHFIALIGKKPAFIMSMAMFIGFLPMCLIALLMNIKSPLFITLAVTVLSIGVAIPLNFLYVFVLNSIEGAKARVSAVMSVGKWVLSIVGFQTASYFYTNDFRSTGYIMLVMEAVSVVTTLYLLKRSYHFKKEMLFDS